jgi:hypothetical protein
VLDLVATQVEDQGKGHCSAMLQALEGWLGPQLGVASLIAVCPADVSAVSLRWSRDGRSPTTWYSVECVRC